MAYSWYDPQVGYCQGLNRLAAIALLFLEEEDAFWCLVTVVNYLLPPDYYNKTLLGSQTDQVHPFSLSLSLSLSLLSLSPLSFLYNLVNYFVESIT